MMKELALDHVQMGRVFSAFLLGYALCQVPAGMLADRFGARRVLGDRGALVGRSRRPLMAVAPRGRGAFRSSSGRGSSSASARRRRSRRRHRRSRGTSRPPRAGRANGFVIAAIGLGSAIAPPLVTAVMVRFGWRVGARRLGAPGARRSRSPGSPCDGCRRTVGGRRPADGARARRPARAGRLATRSFVAPDGELHAAGLRRLHLRLLVLPLPRRRAALRPAAGGAPQQPAVAPLDRLDPARRAPSRTSLVAAARPRLGPARRADGRPRRRERLPRRRRADARTRSSRPSASRSRPRSS